MKQTKFLIEMKLSRCKYTFFFINIGHVSIKKNSVSMTFLPNGILCSNYSSFSTTIHIVSMLVGIAWWV